MQGLLAPFRQGQTDRDFLLAWNGLLHLSVTQRDGDFLGAEKGVGLLHRYIYTLKSKQSNFEGVGVGKAQLGSDPRVGGSVGAELCCEGEAPDLAFFTRRERCEIVRGFVGFDQGFVQDSLPTLLAEELGLHLGESYQGCMAKLFGQGALPSVSSNRPAFAKGIKAKLFLFSLIQSESAEFCYIVSPRFRRVRQTSVPQHQIASKARRALRTRKAGQAARTKRGQLSRLNDFGPNGIEVNVMETPRYHFQ